MLCFAQTRASTVALELLGTLSCHCRRRRRGRCALVRVRTAPAGRVVPPPEPPVAGAPLVRVRTGVGTGARSSRWIAEPLLLVHARAGAPGAAPAAGV